MKYFGYVSFENSFLFFLGLIIAFVFVCFLYTFH
jgi:hypothetical protein